MHASKPEISRDTLTVLATLAGMLERLERSTTPVDPEQYRTVVARLRAALADVSASSALHPLFASSPATAELYENLHYERAGLCLRQLEAATESELQARRVIARACAAR
jgi:hypothetical protein